ncbi:MAG TPA: hypothetical protein VL096_10760, partial [Pirellulaceae bacterium]|nr:hypothetical protein [Pirellulaceae bacterium]
MRVTTERGWGSLSLRAGLLALLLAAGWGSSHTCHALPPQQGEPSRPDDRGADHQDAVHTGFVFVDGNYIEAPYEVRETPGGATINGHAIVMQRQNPPRERERNGRQPQAMNASFIQTAAWENEAPAEQPERRGPPPEWSGRRRPVGPGFGPQRGREPQPGNYLRDELSGNAVVVVFGSQPAVTLQQRVAENFLKYLADPQEHVDKLNVVLAALPPHANREQWQQWLAAYAAPAALATRLDATVSEIERTEVANAWTVTANRRLHNWAYPMTMFGMVMSVLSLGHLLKSPPKNADEQVDQRQRDRLAT